MNTKVKKLAVKGCKEEKNSPMLCEHDCRILKVTKKAANVQHGILHRD